MNDPYPLPPGSIGTILGTDDLGDYLISWNCGSTLKLIPGVDEWECLDSQEVIDESVTDSCS